MLAGAQALSQLGDQLSRIALVALLWAGATAPAAELIRFLVVAGLPAVLLGLAAGWVADRHPTRALLIGCDLGRAVIVTAFPFLVAVTDATWPVYAAFPLLLGLNRAFRVTRGRLLPSWVRSENLARANATLLGVDRVAEIGGAVLAGVVVAAVGWRVGFWLDAGTYLASGALLLLLPAGVWTASRAGGASPHPGTGDLHPGAGAHPVARDSHPGASARTAGLRRFAATDDPLARHGRRDRRAIGADLSPLALVVWPTAVGLAAGALVPWLLTLLPVRFGDGATAIAGLLSAAVAVGAVAAAALTARREPGPGEMAGGTILVGATAWAVLALLARPADLAGPGGAALLVTLAAVAGFVAARILLGSETGIQRAAPPDRLGRWLGVREAGERGAFLVGILTGALMITGPSAAGVAAARGGVLGAVLLAVTVLAAVAGAVLTVRGWARAGTLGGHLLVRVQRGIGGLARVLPVRLVREGTAAIAARTVGLHRAGLAHHRRNLAPLGIEAAPREVLAHYGRAHAESVLLGAGRASELLARVELSGWEHVTSAHEQGRGVLLVGAHLGAWDLTAALLAARLDGIAVFAERLRPEEIFRHYVALRARYGAEVLTGRHGILRAAELLEAGGAVGAMIDRSGDGRGVDVPWGATSIRLPGGPYRLARRAGAAVVPVAVLRTDDGYGLRAAPPLQVPDDLDPEAAVERMAMGFAAVLREWIREAPEQWTMLAPTTSAGRANRVPSS